MGVLVRIPRVTLSVLWACDARCQIRRFGSDDCNLDWGSCFMTNYRTRERLCPHRRYAQMQTHHAPTGTAWGTCWFDADTCTVKTSSSAAVCSCVKLGLHMMLAHTHSTQPHIQVPEYSQACSSVGRQPTDERRYTRQVYGIEPSYVIMPVCDNLGTCVRLALAVPSPASANTLAAAPESKMQVCKLKPRMPFTQVLHATTRP